MELAGYARNKYFGLESETPDGSQDHGGADGANSADTRRNSGMSGRCWNSAAGEAPIVPLCSPVMHSQLLQPLNNY